jgi:uncharacterized protein YndB with AHSA1/START domain
MPAWWLERGKIQRLPDEGGVARFQEQSERSSFMYRFREVQAPKRLVVEIEDPEGYFGGTWTYELEPQNGKTRVTITENGWAGPGFFRFMIWLFGPDATLNGCLDALAKKRWT